MNAAYAVPLLTDEDRDRLQRVYADLMELATCQVPAVRAAARSAVAQIHQALNGEGMVYELYTKNWQDE